MSAFRLARLQMPVAWRWDHNAHYHRWNLDQIPAGARSALDVGCGRGALARRLAERIPSVDAVDRSATMIAAARTHPQSAGSRVNWREAYILDATLESAGYDFVTVLSCLHHLPLEPALAKLSELVRPGGVVAVVGLYRTSSLLDHAIAMLGIMANLLVGGWRATRRRAGKPEARDVPVQEPAQTIAEIKAATRILLPGGRLRRRLFFRYTLQWQRPPLPGP